MQPAVKMKITSIIQSNISDKIHLINAEDLRVFKTSVTHMIRIISMRTLAITTAKLTVTPSSWITRSQRWLLRTTLRISNRTSILVLQGIYQHWNQCYSLKNLPWVKKRASLVRLISSRRGSKLSSSPKEKVKTASRQSNWPLRWGSKRLHQGRKWIAMSCKMHWMMRKTRMCNGSIRNSP